MKRIEKLLVPTDLSDNSRRGLLYACSLAAENKGALTILHVANEFAAWELYCDEFTFLEPARRAWPTDRVLVEANLDLNRFLEPHLNAMKDIPAVNKRLVLGPIAEQIVTAAEEEKADLVVVSPRRNRSLRRILSGGITDRVTRMSPCPVLSVVPPLPSRPWRGALLPVPFRWTRQRPRRFEPMLCLPSTRVGNDMNSICPPENGRREENKEKTIQTSPSAIERVTHDIVNQLSIICLCCCELRHSLAEKLRADQLNELGMIETAVQESARLIEKLKTSLQDHERASKKLPSILTRVEATDSLHPIVSHRALRR